MEDEEKIVLADGFDDALLGVTRGPGGETLAVYSSDRCVDILADGGMKLEEAVEYFDYNVIGAYVGVGTPLFVDEVDMPTLREHYDGLAKDEDA